MRINYRKVYLSMGDVMTMTRQLVNAIYPKLPPDERVLFHPIPRGGIPVGFALMAADSRFTPTDNPEKAVFFLDDIIDSGNTMEEWCDNYPGIPFYALVDKRAEESADAYPYWVVFPWENADEGTIDDSVVGTITNRLKRAGQSFFANDNISAFIQGGEMETLEVEIEKRVTNLLRGLLIDIDHDHNTKGTAKRIARMYLHEVFKGRYEVAPQITEFPNYRHLDEVYVTGPITIRSTCSHHLAPIVGKCWIGVIPGDNVIGLSKFNRLIDWVASRPQIQEELAIQISDKLEELIKPEGLAVIIEATHMCMTWRGVREEPSAKMTTSVMRGAFRDKPEARAEFMSIVTKG